MEPYEWEFGMSEDGNQQWLLFGRDLHATAGVTPPLDWVVELRCKDNWFLPLASTIVVAAGLIALDQRKNHDVIGPFDIGGALKEVAEAETAQQVILTGAGLQIAWEKIKARHR